MTATIVVVATPIHHLVVEAGHVHWVEKLSTIKICALLKNVHILVQPIFALSSSMVVGRFIEVDPAFEITPLKIMSFLRGDHEMSPLPIYPGNCWKCR